MKRTEKIYNKAMNFARVAFLVVSAIMFGASVVAATEGIKNNNPEQVVSAVAIATLSFAAPAVADPNVKRFLTRAGFMGGSGLTRLEETMIAYLEQGGKIDVNTKADYQNGKLRLVNADLYIAANVTNLSGIQPIFNEQTSKKTGVTNVDKAKLPKGVNVCIDRLLVGYAVDGGNAIVDPALMNNYDSVVSSWPAALANGYLNIKVEGQLISDPIPLELCGSMADTTLGRGKVEGYQLITPIFIPEDKQISIEIEFAGTGLNNTSKHHVKVWLLGNKTKPKSGY